MTLLIWCLGVVAISDVLAYFLVLPSSANSARIATPRARQDARSLKYYPAQSQELDVVIPIPESELLFNVLLGDAESL